jgi:MFS family permease
MRPASEREPRPLTLVSFKSSVRSIAGLIVGGGVITWIFLTDGVRDIAYRLSNELQPLYLAQVVGLSIEQIGLLGSFFSGAMMLTPVLSGRIADRWGERVPISGGFLIVSAAYLVFLQAREYPAFIGAWALFGIGIGLLSPAYQSLISKVVLRQLLGAFSGLSRAAWGSSPCRRPGWGRSFGSSSAHGCLL